MIKLHIVFIKSTSQTFIQNNCLKNVFLEAIETLNNESFNLVLQASTQIYFRI